EPAAGAGRAVPRSGRPGAGAAVPAGGRTSAGVAVPLSARTGAGSATPPTGRVGVGPAVPVLRLHESWAAARTALRFTAEEPGRRVVRADELGSLALLADLVGPGTEPPADVIALDVAAATAPWLLATLDAVASTTSLRAAAAEINVHHSTLQDRLAHAEHLLGWPVRTPQGRFRLQLALTMRHLARP
ncbi:MAG: helix-turn-helix domain-containing protein, partial [Streptomyces sp.]|nr:helix-turn-helix domain-containing protein [Streptomyces sp.]